MCTNDQIDWDRFDDECLHGHYLIAALDGRLEDQRLLGEQLIRRGQLSESLHHKHMQRSQMQPPLSKPIIA